LVFGAGRYLEVADLDETRAFLLCELICDSLDALEVFDMDGDTVFGILDVEEYFDLEWSE
jgi:hypothetical protein